LALQLKNRLSPASTPLSEPLGAPPRGGDGTPSRAERRSGAARGHFFLAFARRAATMSEIHRERRGGALGHEGGEEETEWAGDQW
jgi:hypothetical protein